MKKNLMNKKNPFFFSLLLITFAVFMGFLIRLDPDYFWHIKAGEVIFHNGVLTKDIFSWFVSGQYWMSHEWLFEWILYGLKHLFGNIHPLVYSLLGMGLLSFILFYPNLEEMQKNIPYTLLYLIFFFVLFVGCVQARPHLISYSFLAYTIWSLSDLYKNEESKKIYFLPVVTLLWANIHGGSSNLSYLLCFLFLFGGLFSFQFKKIEAKKMSKEKRKKIFLVMILCMFAVCINPHGFKMFLYPYQNMMDTTMIHNISEWRSTSLNEGYHLFYYAFLLFVIFTMLFSEKKIQWMDFLLLGFVSYLGLKSIRFWPFFYIAMTYLIFHYVKPRKMDHGTSFCLGVLSIVLVVFTVLFGKALLPISYQLNLDSSIVEVLEKEKPERLFNMYDFGGELIYHDIPVFIDGRADLYGKYNYKDYLELSMLQKDPVPLIQKYDFDYFLVKKDYPITFYLKNQDEYECIYQKKEILLYKKIVN